MGANQVHFGYSVAGSLTMRIMMHYGKKGFPLDLPEEWAVTVIRKKPMPILADPVEALGKAFANPVGSASLATLARGRRSACIVICDITRPVPNGLILPTLIREVLAAGIGARDITVLVATGLHRPNEGPELLEVVGDPWVLETVKVVNHGARNDDEHVYLGATRRGTPVRLDRRFVEADLKIVIGLVEPHFMAGYSGGRKVITPGIAHWQTITAIHSARFLEHEQAANCVLEGNPLHEELSEIAQMAGESLAINVVIDEMRRISYLNFGDLRLSHESAMAYMRPYAEVSVPQKFKTVVTSAAGYPLDKNYYQTVKGMVAAMNILESGGNLFILSECSEGMGSAEFIEAQKRLCTHGMDGFMEGIRPRLYAEVDEWETEMLLKPLRIGTVHLHSEGLCAADKALTGVCVVELLEDALRKSVEQAHDPRVAVIPEGPYVIPIYSSEPPSR
jgi:nickel-dependent lactate racemase